MEIYLKHYVLIYSAPDELNTGFVFCCVVRLELNDFDDNQQGYLTDIEPIMRLSQCQRSNPE